MATVSCLTFSCLSAMTCFVTPLPFLSFFCSDAMASVKRTCLARLCGTHTNNVRTHTHCVACLSHSVGVCAVWSAMDTTGGG